MSKENICNKCGYGNAYKFCGCGKWHKEVLALLTRIADSLEKAANPMMTVKSNAHIYAELCVKLAGMEGADEIKEEVKKILGLEE